MTTTPDLSNTRIILAHASEQAETEALWYNKLVDDYLSGNVL